MIFPEFANMKLIDDIREKYDPLAKHVKPHITLVFPFDSHIDTNELRDHLIHKLEGIHPFYIRLKGITPIKSYGNYLYLNIQEGKEAIVDIHHKLYTELLAEHMPEWLRKGNYYPHMTVGNIDDEEEYNKAIKEIKDFNEVFETIVQTISVEIIDENEDSIIELTIPLKNRSQ